MFKVVIAYKNPFQVNKSTVLDGLNVVELLKSTVKELKRIGSTDYSIRAVLLNCTDSSDFEKGLTYTCIDGIKIYLRK